jgi:hypothetical protein
MQQRPMDRAPKPTVADLAEAPGQHVLQKAADEFQRRQGQDLPAMLPGVLVPETDLIIVDGELAVVH